MQVTDSIRYVGVNDHQVDLFEGQYQVPNGMSYNSYVILDEKVAVMDTVDIHFGEEWMANVKAVLAGRTPDYLIVQHMEPDHCSVIPDLFKMYPEMKIISSVQAFKMMENFYHIDTKDRSIVIKEGDTLSLGKHELHFISAPMVHWPEVMMTYESTTGTLFSADAFGAFGAMSGNIFADEVRWDHDWRDEARRYYVNIVGKYGPQTQAVLKKASTLDIKMICPLHAHIWRKDFEQILSRYHQWSTYEPQRYSVAIFYGSIYGNTQNAAEILAMKLAEEGMRSVMVFDTSKTEQNI